MGSSCRPAWRRQRPRPPDSGRRAVAAAGLALLFGATAQAQTPDSAVARRGTWTITPFVGAARHSPVGSRWGVTPDRSHLFLGVHFAAPVLRLGPATLSYAPNVVPLLVLTNNPRYGTVPGGADGEPQVVEVGRGAVLGTGFSPLGLQLGIRVHRRIEVYGASALGGLWFAREVPVADARQFNYSLEWGGGVHVRTAARQAVQLGYKFHHLSNLYTARVNSGVDANLFYVGLQWQARLPRE